jgi:hypothetical protein
LVSLEAGPGGGTPPVFLPFARSVSTAIETAHAADPNGSVVVRVGSDTFTIDLRT